jgi:hypothetical protein
MKRFTLFLLFLALVTGYCTVTLAQSSQQSVTALGYATASGQVTCAATPTLLYATTQSGNPSPYGRLSVIFQNQSNQAVYISPSSSITTSNAGVMLTQGQGVTFDRSNGQVSWYCITASSTATVGWTEEK